MVERPGQGGLKPTTPIPPDGSIAPLTPKRLTPAASTGNKRTTPKKNTVPRSEAEYRAQGGGFLEPIKTAGRIIGREGPMIGKIVQNVPAGTAKFFGGLATDFTLGLGRQIVYNMSYGNIGSEYVPRTSIDTLQSFARTAQFWNRIPEYQERLDAGQAISDLLIEDIGNLSIIGRGFRAPVKGVAKNASDRASALSATASTLTEGAAKTLIAGGPEAAAQASAAAAQASAAATRAARLNKIASRANKVTEATNRVIYYSDVAGTYPFKPYVWAGKNLGKAIREGVYVEGIVGWGGKAAQSYIAQIDALRQAEPDINPKDPRLTDLQKKAARSLRQSLSHSTRQQIRQAVRNATHEENAVSRGMLDIKRNPLLKDEINPATGEVWGELTPFEEQAIMSVLNGRAGLVKALSEKTGIPAERLAELGKFDESPEYWLTPQGARLAMDFVEGRLTPEHYDRLSNALNLLAEGIINETQKAVTGFGRRNLLSPDYLLPLPFINKLKKAVMESKNPELIELWLALEEAGILIPLKQAIEEGFTEDMLQLREEALVGFVRNLPDELALDPSMYPANMRENIEFYRRVRRSLNRRAVADADGKPLPEPDGSPRAPKEPWFPFEEDVEAGITRPEGPEQFEMTRRSGKLDAAETKLGAAREKISRIAEKVLEITDKIADLEVKHAKLVERVRKYDIVEDYVAGMNAKAIARKYRLPIADVEKLLKQSVLVRRINELQAIEQRMSELQKTIGVKRARLAPGDFDAELLLLQEQTAEANIAAENARKALEAARSMDNIARMADESAIDRLTEEMDLAEDALLDRETEYEDAGGDLNDLRVDVDPRDPEVGPVTPEMAESELLQLTEIVGEITMKLGSEPLAQTATRTVQVLNASWDQAINFYEAATTDAQVAVGELRLQQLGDMITDLSESVVDIVINSPENVNLEQTILDRVNNFVNSPDNQSIIAGTAPFSARGVQKFTGVKPLYPEGQKPTRNPVIENGYLPAFDPNDIYGSMVRLADEADAIQRSVEFTYRLPDTQYPTEIVFENYNDPKLNISIAFEATDNIGADWNIGLDIDGIAESSFVLTSDQIYKLFDEASQRLDQELKKGNAAPRINVFLRDEELVDFSVEIIIADLDKLDKPITEASQVIGPLEQVFEKLFGPRDSFVAIAKQPRLRAVDEIIEVGGPLPDPELEARANQMSENVQMLDEAAINAENYRSVTKAIDELQNPTPEDIEAFKAQAVEAARQELNAALGLLENLGGVVTGDNVTFTMNVRRGTPEWDWWEQLDPAFRKKVARKYFRSEKIKSTAAKGPRIARRAFNIDQVAADIGLDVEQWADQFLEGIRLHEQAQRDLKRAQSGDIDTETFVRENPELQEAIAYRDNLEEQGINQDTVDVYDRAKAIRSEKETASIPDNPAEVRLNDAIIDPVVRVAAYEADVLVAIAKDAANKMRRAESAQARYKAFQEYISEYWKYQKTQRQISGVRNASAKAKLKQEKNEAQQRKLREKQRGLKAKSKAAKTIENRLLASPSYEFATGLPGALPLETALQGGYPAEQFAVDVPLTEGGLETVALRGPMYMPTGRPRQFTGGLKTEVIEAGLPGFNKLTSEHYRDGDRQTIFSIRLLADRLGKEARKMSENEAYRAIVAQFGMTALDLLGQETSFGLYEKAYELVSNMSEDSRFQLAAAIVDEDGNRLVDGLGSYATGVVDPRTIFNLALKEQYGRLLTQEMNFRGYAAVDPYNTITSVVPLDKITHESMFLPEGVREYIAQRETIVDPNAFNVFWRSAHKITSVMKTTTLVLSVAWQIGDLVSNVIIGQMTGVDVRTMIDQMKRVAQEEYGTGMEGVKTMVDPRREMPTPTPRIRIAQESPIQDIGFSQSERNYLRGIPTQESIPLLTRLTGLKYPGFLQGRSVAKVAFRINETLNRISRHAYFLELLDRKLQENGQTLDQVAADGSWRNDPELKKAIFEVADTANDWLGDFADLSMAERKYVTPFIPFYSWTKHIHKVFLMMGREHPASLRWYVYLGTLNFDPDEDPMNLRYGNPSVFGGVVNLNPFNPFADVFSGPVAQYIQEGNIQPALSQLGPVPRLIGGLGAGIDVTKASRLQRPPGSGAYTESGLQQSMALWRNPGEALGFTLMQFPIAARALNVLPGERIPGTQIALGPVTRYQTGEARLKPGTEKPIERWGGRPAALGRMFSLPLIPYQSDEQIEEVKRSAERRLRTVKKSKEKRERYLKSIGD